MQRGGGGFGFKLSKDGKVLDDQGNEFKVSFVQRDRFVLGSSVTDRLNEISQNVAQKLSAGSDSSLVPVTRSNLTDTGSH